MKKKPLLVAIALAFTAGTALASPADDVMTPDIEKGEREFELAYGADRNDAGKYESALELSFGAGMSCPTDFVFQRSSRTIDAKTGRTT